MPSEMSKDHLYDFLFRYTSLQQQSDCLRYRPTILTQESFPQQAQVFVSAFVPGIPELNPDCILSNVHRKRLQIVAFIIETTTALQIETPAMPVTRENAVPDRTTRQRITHMWALVVCRIDPAIDVEQRDTAPIAELDGFRFTGCNIAERSNANPLRCGSGHSGFLSFRKIDSEDIA